MQLNIGCLISLIQLLPQNFKKNKYLLLQTGPCSNIIISSNLALQKVSKKEGGLSNSSAKPQVGGSSHV